MYERLTHLAKLVQGAVVADIGTDHGRLPEMLLKNPDVKRVIATDISADSLQKCADLLAEHPQKQKLELKVTDGLSGVDTETVDSIVMAGMGGHRIIGIMKRALAEKKTLRRLILSPQKGEEEVRRFLHEAGFAITDDFRVKEAGKYYTLLAAVPGSQHYERDAHYRYGKIPLETKDPVLREWLKRELAIQEGVVKQAKSPDRRKDIEMRIKHLKEVLDELQTT